MRRSICGMTRAGARYGSRQRHQARLSGQRLELKTHAWQSGLPAMLATLQQTSLRGCTTAGRRWHLQSQRRSTKHATQHLSNMAGVVESRCIGSAGACQRRFLRASSQQSPARLMPTSCICCASAAAPPPAASTAKGNVQNRVTYSSTPQDHTSACGTPFGAQQRQQLASKVLVGALSKQSCGNCPAGARAVPKAG